LFVPTQLVSDISERFHSIKLLFVSSNTQGDLALTGVGSLEQRTGLISKGLSMFSERPFFGFGLGSFSFQKGVASALSHNDYIQILSEQGIFGLVVFLTILNTYIYKAYISYKNS